jgi:hypothetical protein
MSAKRWVLSVGSREDHWQVVTLSNADGNLFPIHLLRPHQNFFPLLKRYRQLIGKARHVSNFNYLGIFAPGARCLASADAHGSSASGQTVNKIVRFVRGAARHARELDDEAPRRSS